MANWYYASGGETLGPIEPEALRELVRKGTITGETLVWRKGLGEWTPASNIPEVADAIEEVPPPLPQGHREQPQPTLIAERRDTHIEEALASALAQPLLAGPWQRFCARYIDVFLYIIALGFAIGHSTANWLPSLYLSLRSVDGRLLTIILLPLAMFLISITMAIFGTSPGKLLLGINVRNLRKSNPFMFHLKREFYVWGSGMALGLPLFNLFAMYNQYKALRDNKSASYDEGVSVVTSRGSSVPRLAFGLIVCFALFSYSIYSTTHDTIQKRDELRTVSWTNPISGKLITIPGIWQTSELKTNSGKAYHFEGKSVQSEVVLGYEDISEYNLNSKDYAEAIKEAVKSDIAITSHWYQKQAGGRTVLYATGEHVKSSSVRITITILLIGNNAWRTISFVNGRRNEEDVPEVRFLVNSLLFSAS